MFEGIVKFFKKMMKQEAESSNSKDTAKERLHLVLMQDRANVSADFLELMKQEIIDVIKKYIDVDENAIDVRLTNKNGENGENGAPALYANIPILNIKNDMKKIDPATGKTDKQEDKKEEKQEEKHEESNKEIKQSNEKNESKEDESKEKENKKKTKENNKNKTEETKEQNQQETKQSEN